MNEMSRIIVIAVASFFLPCILVHGDENELEATWNAVAAKYPTREQLIQRVNAYKSEHPAEFAAAKSDFELAVRSIVGLDIPLSPDDKRRHVIRRQYLPHLKTRDSLLRAIASFRSDGSPDALQCADFWESHFEEVVIDQTPAHRYVYLECLLNGWNDWSNWTTPKLVEIRERYSDVYLKYALERMRLLRTEEDYAFFDDAMRVALEVLEQESLGSESRYLATSFLQRLGGSNRDQDVMKYCVLKYHHTNERSFLDVSSSIDRQLTVEQHREFWVPYLSSANDELRLYAVSGIGNTIRKPRMGEAPRPEDAALADQLRQIAENDSNPLIRRDAQYRIRLYDKSDTRPTHGRLGVPKPP